MGRAATVGVSMSSVAVFVLSLLAITACDEKPVTTPTITRIDNEGNNTLRGRDGDVHGLLIDETADVFKRGMLDGLEAMANPAGIGLERGASNVAAYTSRVVETPFPFNELIPSYNIDVPEGSGFMVEVRVGRGHDGWSPFYYFGKWGAAGAMQDKTVRSEHGAVNIDYFQSSQTFDRVQYRVHLFPSPAGSSPMLRRFALAYSNTTDDAKRYQHLSEKRVPGSEKEWQRRLPVPWRSQLSEDAAIAGEVCSPTSVAMVMAYRGIDRPTAEVACAVYDVENKIYGNWARAVQGAYTFGVPGYLMRFGDWATVKACIGEGHPIIASIRIGKGQLSNQPRRVSGGHLIVIVGFDGNGNVHVNDPGVSSEQQGTMSHPIEDLTKVWLANGGVGYVLLPRKRGHHSFSRYRPSGESQAYRFAGWTPDRHAPENE
jgi:hypothetical protein